MKIGEQLFGLRDFCQTPKALDETLRKVHEIGYRYVQLSAVCRCEPEILRDMLAVNGLQAVVCHADKEQLLADPEGVMRYYDTVGCPYIGIGAMPVKYRGSLEGCRAFAEEYEPVLQAFTANGRQLFYHNHGFDFKKYEDGSCNLDYLARDERFSLLLDVYWIHLGGHSAEKAILKAAERCKIVHFKDLEPDGNTPQCGPVLRGNLDWDGIYEACLRSGIEYAFVEQDFTYHGEDPFFCAKLSYDNMKKKGWL